VIDPHTGATGRTRLFASVEVLDHEYDEWATWAFVDDAAQVNVEALLQDAVDAGHDDIRLVLHVAGC